MGWKVVPQTDPFLSNGVERAPVRWVPAKITVMLVIAAFVCLAVIVAVVAWTLLATHPGSGTPDVSMSSLPIDGQWRIVAEVTSETSGGCEDGICIAYGVITPTSAVAVTDAEAALVTRLRHSGWACMTPHPGGSIAMVGPDRRSWTEMEPVANVDIGSTDPANIMARAAQTNPGGTVGLAVWVNASPDATVPAILPFHNGGCPQIPS